MQTLGRLVTKRFSLAPAPPLLSSLLIFLPPAVYLSLCHSGLILQDLTFVHLGNPDLVEGKVNFSKRWQQFNILDSMRRFQQV